MDKTLIGRFEPYFMHPNPNRPVLQVGDNANACANIKTALAYLGFARSLPGDPRQYDRKLSQAVRRFQKEKGNRNCDGLVGPGTRALLISTLLQEVRASWFVRLDGSDVPRSVFLSYAWRDSVKVNKLDQWLRDNNVRVIRDKEDFTAGSNIKDNILKSVGAADKVIAVYSRNSKNRDWPTFERVVAEQLEKRIDTPVLIYLNVDASPLKVYDPHRIAIVAKGKTLKQIGQEILKALNVPMLAPHYDYNEDEPI